MKALLTACAAIACAAMQVSLVEDPQPAGAGAAPEAVARPLPRALSPSSHAASAHGDGAVSSPRFTGMEKS